MRDGFFLGRRAGRLAAAAGLVVLAAVPAGAANKEHQQMMAEIRMLQEQNAQLQQSIGTLVDALKTVTAKIDEQSAASRKTAADQRLLIDGLSGEMRIVREKLDDTNVRLGSISQEVDSLRSSIARSFRTISRTTSMNVRRPRMASKRRYFTTEATELTEKSCPDTHSFAVPFPQCAWTRLDRRKAALIEEHAPIREAVDGLDVVRGDNHDTTTLA